MTEISEILTPVDPFRMTTDERRKLRATCEAGPALKMVAPLEMQQPQPLRGESESLDELAPDIYQMRRETDQTGWQPTLAARQAAYLIDQIDRIEGILRDVPEGQQPPHDTMMTLLAAWLDYNDMASPPPMRDVYPSRREGLEWHRDEVHSYTMHRRKAATFEALIETAKHDRGAYEAALALATTATRAGRATPKQSFWLCRVAEGKVKKPSTQRANRYKKAVIVRMVEIANVNKYHPTKGHENTGGSVSGCDLVADALTLANRIFEEEKRLTHTYEMVKREYYRGRK